jgi:thioredoxin reductase (NADPH)
MKDGKLTVYGTAWCSDCKLTKQFLGEQRIQYDWVNVEDDAKALAAMEKLQQGGHIVPTVLFADGSVMVEPSNAELAEKLGVSTRARCDYYDVIVVGGGPAGLTAALYTAREGLSTLVIDRAGMGGQAAITERLDNFPGFPEGVTGAELAARLVQQVHRFDVETVSAQAVAGIDEEGEYRVVRTEDGSEYSAKAVLVATGSKYKRLGVPGEAALIGSGVHYCATCDGPFYKGKRLAVIGGGNSAVEEGIFLTRFASHVTLLVRDDKLDASQVALEKLAEYKDKMQVLFETEVVEMLGKDNLEGVRIRNVKTGQTSLLEPAPAGLFLFIGLEPNTGFLPKSIKRNKQGFVVTSTALETTMPGVFAAGDVRAGSTNQAASAAGEGATAALMMREYLRKMG